MGEEPRSRRPPRCHLEHVDDRHRVALRKRAERDVRGDRGDREEVRADAAKLCDEVCEIVREVVDPSCSDVGQRCRRMGVNDCYPRRRAALRAACGDRPVADDGCTHTEPADHGPTCRESGGASRSAGLLESALSILDRKSNPAVARPTGWLCDPEQLARHADNLGSHRCAAWRVSDQRDARSRQVADRDVGDLGRPRYAAGPDRRRRSASQAPNAICDGFDLDLSAPKRDEAGASSHVLVHKRDRVRRPQTAYHGERDASSIAVSRLKYPKRRCGSRARRSRVARYGKNRASRLRGSPGVTSTLSLTPACTVPCPHGAERWEPQREQGLCRHPMTRGN